MVRSDLAVFISVHAFTSIAFDMAIVARTSTSASWLGNGAEAGCGRSALGRAVTSDDQAAIQATVPPLINSARPRPLADLRAPRASLRSAS